jgi:hypothetical protein
VSAPRSHRLCDDAAVLQLWQAEWRPSSHRVWRRPSELGLDWVERVVPLDRGERDTMEAAIPTIVDNHTAAQRAGAIVAELDQRKAEPEDAGRHRAQMRARRPHRLEREGDGQGR